ncbi:hypothetical protein BU23DRAFT_553960, partial [Bimuria novae-zelandiae CBS 107.79]
TTKIITKETFKDAACVELQAKNVVKERFLSSLIRLKTLSLYSNAAVAKRSGHKRFLYDLIKQLFDRGTRLCNARAKRKRLDDVVVAKESSYRSANLYKQAKTCVLCAERGRRQHKSQPPRVALGHV